VVSDSDTPRSNLSLSILDHHIAICRLEKDSKIPSWIDESRGFLSITKTQEELSIVCEEDVVPSGVKTEKGWRALKVNGILDFSLTGVLASILNPLAEAKISVFAISTFDSDYILVKAESLDSAVKALRKSYEIAA
jgi:hypothetical protein